MKPNGIVIASLFICLLASLAARAAERTVTEGHVSAVTVYQGQALVTRELEVPDAQGLHEVVVTNLPESVLPGSLFAEPADGVEIRSVRYRDRPIEEDVRQEVRDLDEQIQSVQDKLAAVTQERTLLEQRKGYLTQLEIFTAGTSKVELAHGVLNAQTLKDLSQFLFAERERIAKRELELAQDERTHNQEQKLLTRKRETVAAGSARSIHEAVVFINSPQPGAAKLRLSYLVGNASWSPSYNLRATEARDQVTLEYNASVQQMSGEDWKDVAMTLSTATPSLVAKAPRLEALAIKLGAPDRTRALAMSAADSYKQAQESRAQIEKLRGGSSLAAPAVPEELAVAGRVADAAGSVGGLRGGVGSWGLESANTAYADAGLNRAASELQLLDFNNALSELKRKDERSLKPDEGVSVSYELANRTSLPSRSDRQLIQIAAVPLKGDFYRLATPVLTSFVYEEARLTNTSDRVFLAGPVATFLGGQFVGRGEIPTVTIGESFCVGLGIDSSLRAERELVNKEERIQGGNRVVDFTYELSLENFSDKPAKVRLLDRLPTVGENDIKVTLVKSDDKVSDDELYQKTEHKDGILRWDVEAPAQAIGPKAKVLRYTMQIEYDKQLSIIGMTEKK
ncbi:MAG TPA: mucoidy inhibitor MuiA family protein [Lacipirellulaceae bacterium]|jgi:hypothetical protein